MLAVAFGIVTMSLWAGSLIHFKNGKLEALPGSVLKQGEKTFTWRGIRFIYPPSWEAEVWKYGSSAMLADDKADEVGFRVWKLDSQSQPGLLSGDFNFEYYIEAGGLSRAVIPVRVLRQNRRILAALICPWCIK